MPNRDARRLIVLSGGACSGKTTVTRALHAGGHHTVPECAIDVIRELAREHGGRGHVAWRDANFQEFEILIARKQIEREAGLPDTGLIFLDRGVQDTIGYCRQRGVAEEPLHELATSSYDMVFLLETIPEFEIRSSTGRTCSFEESVEVGRLIGQVYTEYGYSPIPVPVMPVEERAAFILSRVQDRTITERPGP